MNVEQRFALFLIGIFLLIGLAQGALVEGITVVLGLIAFFAFLLLTCVWLIDGVSGIKKALRAFPNKLMEMVR